MGFNRPVFINNTLSQGICNYNCNICGVNKPVWTAAKKYQDLETAGLLKKRIIEAFDEGLRVHYLALSGNGEPTLHPEYQTIMDLWGRLPAELEARGHTPPEISMVTNALTLSDPGVLDAVTRNNFGLLISFPTPDPSHYGEIMMMDSSQGQELLDKVVPGIRLALQDQAAGRLKDLKFHISPPYRKYIRPDFDLNVRFLASLASEARQGEIELVVFPSSSNRTGLVSNFFKGIDFFPDFFRKYNDKEINKVRIRMTHVGRRMYPSPRGMLDILLHYDYPCLSLGNFFITADGDTVCYNDQNMEEPKGNIRDHSLRELLEIRKRMDPLKICPQCNLYLKGIYRYRRIFIYGVLANLKMLWVSIRRRLFPVRPPGS